MGLTELKSEISLMFLYANDTLKEVIQKNSPYHLNHDTIH